MATLYLRPTSDIYSTHPRYPAESTNVYTLINEEVSDGSATYIDLSPSTTDKRETYSSSFAFAGVDFPLKEFEITDIYIQGRASKGSYMTEGLITFSVKSNGIDSVSDVLTISSTITDRSFDRNGEFLNMINEYIHTNGKLPDITITITTHIEESKNSTIYLTQLYLAIKYNACVARKVRGLIGSYWTKKANRVYKKANGIWTEVTDGISQVGNRLYKKGHHHVPIGYIAPTCTKTGLTEGNKCAICGEVFEEREEIPAKGHNPHDISAVEPTCGKVGYTAGTFCYSCLQYLSGHEEIPATGEHTPEDVAAVEPTCSTVGYTAGTKCSVCGEYLSGHEEIPATGEHTWVSAEDGIAATDVDTGLISREKCSVCGTYRDSNYVAIPITGTHTHNYELVEAKAATCIAEGYLSYYKCSGCGAVQDDIEILPIDPNNHAEIVIDAAVNPSRTETGLTEGKHCAACGKVIVAQEVAPVVTSGWLVHGYAVNDDNDGAIGDAYFEEDWGYVIINGVKYLNQFSNVNVKEGDIVQVHVNAQYATHEDECWVELNGVEVQSGSGTYNLTVTGDTTIVIARREEKSDWRIGKVWRARITMG